MKKTVKIMEKKKRTERYEYALEGHTVQEFAERFGISVQSARCYYSRNKIPYKKNRERILSLYSLEEIAEYAKNHTIPEISSHFNVKYISMRFFVARYKLKHKMKRESTSEKEKMILFLSGRFSLSSIANAFGVSRQYIFQVIKKKGDFFNERLEQNYEES